MTTFEDAGVIMEELRCCECGRWTMVGALGFPALPDIDRYIGPCCRRYIGDHRVRGERVITRWQIRHVTVDIADGFGFDMLYAVLRDNDEAVQRGITSAWEPFAVTSWPTNGSTVVVWLRLAEYGE